MSRSPRTDGNTGTLETTLNGTSTKPFTLAAGGTGGFSGLTTLCGLFDDSGQFINSGFAREFAEAIAGRLAARPQGADAVVAGLLNGRVMAIVAGYALVTALAWVGTRWLVDRFALSPHLADFVLSALGFLLPGVVGLKGPLSCLTQARYGIAWGALGAADACYQCALDYALNRIQFEKPIGVLGALQTHAANMAVDLEGMKYITYLVAWKVNDNQPFAKDVAMAKAWCSEAYRRICDLAHQCHGAIGFCEDHDLPLYSRRAKTYEFALGDSRFQRRFVAKEIGL